MTHSPRMRHTRDYLTGFLLALAACLPGLAGAQKTSDLPVYEYRDGRIRGGMPYGEAFILRGRSLLPGATQQADVVQIQLFEEIYQTRRRRQERRLRRNRPVNIVYDTTQAFYTASWWWAEGREADVFDLYIERPLRPDTYYKVRLNFYNRYRIDDAVTRRLVDDVKRGVFAEMQRAGRMSVRVEDIETALRARVATLGDSLRFGYLQGGGDGSIQFSGQPGRPLSLAGDIAFTPELETDVARVIREEMSLKADAAKLDSLQRLLRRKADDPATQSLLRAFEEALIASGGQPGMFLREDIDALRRLVTAGVSSTFSPFVRLLAWLEAHPEALNPVQQGMVLSLESLYDNLVQLEQAQQQRLDRIRILDGRIGAGGLDQLIAEGFVLAGSAEVVSSPFSERSSLPADPDAAPSLRTPGETLTIGTGYNAINIGTAYGVSVVGMNFGAPVAGQTAFSLENTEADMISYLGVKFYFSKIDKSLRIDDPYPLFRDRFSMLAGIKVTGTLDFKGREMGNVIGVQPVAGLSFDLNRALSLDAGFVFFEEASLSPLSPVQRLRTAPFVGLSVDANAFNAMKNLINGLR